MLRVLVTLKAVILALAFGPLATLTAVAEPQQPPSAAAQSASSQPASSGNYYIEFRAAAIGTYGHSYIAYGRLNDKGRPVQTNYADLHPVGNYALMALGHVVPVPANTDWNPEVLNLPVSSSYRRTLSAADYRKLLAAIQNFRAKKQPYWNAVTYNCNNFVADMATAIGLKAPSALLPSFAFIPALRDLNEAGRRSSEPAMDRKPAAQARQRSPS